MYRMYRLGLPGLCERPARIAPFSVSVHRSTCKTGDVSVFAIKESIILAWKMQCFFLVLRDFFRFSQRSSQIFCRYDSSKFFMILEVNPHDVSARRGHLFPHTVFSFFSRKIFTYFLPGFYKIADIFVCPHKNAQVISAILHINCADY